MIASTAYLLRAISETLKEEVLPVLEAASMPAGNLRGCLMLLAYLEDRVTKEGTVLVENNKTLRRVLRELGVDEALTEAGDLRARIETTLMRYPDRERYVGIPELARENEAYQELLSEVLRCAHERGNASGAEPYKALRQRLRACLITLDEREYSLVERAETFTPI